MLLFYIFPIIINAAKYIVTTSSNNIITFEERNLFNTNEINNIIEPFNIGNLKGYIMEYTMFPQHIYNYSFISDVEEDQKITINSAFHMQKNPIWNLDRIDQRSNHLNNKFFYYTTSGENVTVFVVDTGIDITHTEFQGRAKWGNNNIDDIDNDCNGHGTHVAGTIGSKTYGVAKKTTLVAVKVLDCNGSGSYSALITGFQYIYNYHARYNNPQNLSSVINLSLGGPKSNTINKAVNQLTKFGIHTVVAAGNENSDACYTSPASDSSVMTVGATTKYSELAYFSNWGICVDILAPGTEILSTYPDNKTAILQGTSMASPLISGIYALLLSNKIGQIKPDIMKKSLIKKCSKGYIKNIRNDTVNCLGYSF